MHNRKTKMPPLEWVRAFEAAARNGSFTEAAAETGLTQPAISQRIGQLEKFLGTPLFHRRPRSIALTVEAEAWLPHVQSALDNIKNSAEALFSAGSGKFTISASLSMIELWLQPRLSALRDIAGGQISIQTLVLGAHEAPVDDVIRIRYGSGDWPHIYKAKLFAEEIAPLASPELARTQPGEDWTRWPRIATSGPRPSWNDWAARYGIPTTPVPHLRYDTFAPALGAARAGMGVILGSLPLCQSDLDAGRLIRLGSEQLEHHESYWIIAGRDALTNRQWDALMALTG
jgi:LysR family glycine cleavage system transcriptional activator